MCIVNSSEKYCGLASATKATACSEPIQSSQRPVIKSMGSGDRQIWTCYLHDLELLSLSKDQFHIGTTGYHYLLQGVVVRIKGENIWK